MKNLKLIQQIKKKKKMNNIKNYLYSPLIGAIFSTILLFIFSVITTIENTSNSAIQVIFGGLSILPFLMIITYLISLFLFLITQQLIKLLSNIYIISEGLSWFIGFVFGLLIAIAILSLTHFNILSFKGISIILSLSFGLMFNMSLYSVLSGKIKPKHL